MLEGSDKFFQEVKKPQVGDPHTFNASMFLREELGSCSVDSKVYKSWPEYCQRHKYISSLNGPLPDMIIPKNFIGIKTIAEGKNLDEGGMV